MPVPWVHPMYPNVCKLHVPSRTRSKVAVLLPLPQRGGGGRALYRDLSHEQIKYTLYIYITCFIDFLFSTVILGCTFMFSETPYIGTVQCTSLVAAETHVKHMYI